MSMRNGVQKFFLNGNIFSLIFILAFSIQIIGQEIHNMAKEGNIDSVKVILEKKGSLLNCADEIGYTPLHWALIREKWDLAEYLIVQGASLNIQGNDGGTPLHCAANHDNPDIVLLLLEKGAKVNVPNNWGNTALSIASQRGCIKTAKVLIDANSDINVKSNEGWTPLHYAYKCGHKKMQEILIKNGASDTIKDSFGKIPSDYHFERPREVFMKPEKLNEYVGLYSILGGSTVKIVVQNNHLVLEEFAADQIYPIASDEFYDYREPWKIRFYRNTEGEVDKIAIDFQRQTIVGKKVKSKDELIEIPKLGIKIHPVSKNDVNNDVLQILFFECKANRNIQLVTFVQENSVSFKSGLHENDIILEFNNVKLSEPGDIFRLLYDVKADSIVPVKILRDSTEFYLNLNFKL